MLNLYNISNNLLTEAASYPANLEVYINPTPEEKQVLINTYNIDEHTLSSALDPDEVSRLEMDPDYLFVLWKRPRNYSALDEFVFNVSSVGIFLVKDKLVIIMPDEMTILEHRKFIKINSVRELMLNFLYQSIQHYMEHLKVIKQISREIQQKINLAMENEHLIIMFNISESLVYYLNALSANNAVLTKLRNNVDKLGFSEDDKEMIDDIIIENNQCYRQSEIYSNILSGLMDARGTLVNNNMNVLIKNLTIINVIFLPLNLLASIGGMSEFSAWTNHIDWKISYSVLGLIMIIVAFLTSVVINRINWFNKGLSNMKASRILNIFKKKQNGLA